MEKNKLSLLEQHSTVEVLYSPAANQVIMHEVKLPVNAQDELQKMTVQEVLLKSGLLAQFSLPNINSLLVGIWGRKVGLDTWVNAGDRIEIYRPLIVDPKEARRRRYQTQGPVRSRHRPGYKGS